MSVRPALLDGVAVLLVEDDDDLRDMLASALDAHGAHVTKAGSLAEARSAMRVATHDVLVTDLRLPDGDGHALGDEALRRGVEAAIALTGDKREESVDASSASGFRVHLTKPVDPDTLARVIASFELVSGER